MSSHPNGYETMQFLDTTNYQRPTTEAGSLNIPDGWQRFSHPNGDIYYYNQGMRLITPEDIRNPRTLRHVLEARNDHLECLRDERNSFSRLPNDWELTLSDVTPTTAVIGMFSRAENKAYHWWEDVGLVEKPIQHFWSHVAEYPSHHPELPFNAETKFVEALRNARASVVQGVVFPFTGRQIDIIIERYNQLKAAKFDSARNAVPALGWLIGAVMPLDAVQSASRYSDAQLSDLMARMQV